MQKLEIGASVHTGDVAGTVNGVPMTCTLDGVLRGILPDDTPVHKGMKAGVMLTVMTGCSSIHVCSLGVNS